MPIIELNNPLGVGTLGQGQSKYSVAQYNFAALGGAIGAIPLLGSSLPQAAIIIDSLIIIDTIITGGAGATIALSVESAGDIQSAAAFGGAPWSTTGAKHGTRNATAAPVTTTAIRPIVATIAGNTLTAGRFRVAVKYLEAP
jgi:hypothetical protein